MLVKADLASYKNYKTNANIGIIFVYTYNYCNIYQLQIL